MISTWHKILFVTLFLLPGFIFTSNSEEADRNNIDVVLPAVVNYILSTKGRESVEEFISEVRDNLKDKDKR